MVENRKLDLVTLEVIRNALPAITNEMSHVLQRTSYNMMIYEVRDYCCGLISPEGDLLSQNTGGVSHFVADLGTVIKDGVEKYGKNGFRPGDLIITNHQRVVRHKPFFFVQGNECLTRLSSSDDNPIFFQLIKIECMWGWPVSIMTKLVTSTRLLMGLSPTDISLS